jgi:integrase
MLTAGANPEWVASYLGHIDRMMVRTLYGSWIPDNDRAEAERVWSHLGAEMIKMPQKIMSYMYEYVL